MQVDDISARLGMSPTLAYNKGDESNRGKARLWTLWDVRVVGPEHAFDIDELLGRCMDVLSGHDRELRALLSIEGVTGYLGVEARFGNTTPSCHLDPQLMMRISQTGLSIDLDLYWDPDACVDDCSDGADT